MKKQIDLYGPGSGGGGGGVLRYLAFVCGYVPLNRLWPFRVLSLLKTGYAISLL